MLKWMLSAFVATFALSSACTSQGVVSPLSISKNQSRELPEAAARDRIVRQFAEILISTPAGTPGVTPVRPLEDIWFWTIPRATQTPGVCQSDRVIFTFTPTLSGDGDADTPTRVSGISAEPRYHLLDPTSTAPPAYLTEQGVAELNHKCADLDPESTDFVAAADASLASSGSRLFAQMKAEAAANANILKLECFREELRAGDIAVFHALTFADVMSIDRCDPDRGVTGSACTRFKFWDFTADVHTRPRGLQTEIDRIEASQQIVLWHTRID